MLPSIPAAQTTFPVMIVPANTICSSYSSSVQVDADNTSNNDNCTIQHPSCTGTFRIEEEEGQDHHSTTATMHMKLDNENRRAANKMVASDLYASEEDSSSTTNTTTAVVVTPSTSTTGEARREERSCSSNNNSNNKSSSMPLALDDPLRANLLVVAHIALGELWATDRNIVEPALKRLSDLCTEKKTADAVNNRTAFQLIKGYAIIVEVMNLWRTDRKIQYLCCLVVLNVAEGGATTGNSDNNVVDDDIDAGSSVIEAVVAAMKAFPTFFPVQLCGCGALTSLCRISKQNAHHLVHNLMGIETIIYAIQRYPNATNLHVWARWCLQSILQWEDFRKAFLDAWVRSTLDDAMFQKLKCPLRPVVPSP